MNEKKPWDEAEELIHMHSARSGRVRVIKEACERHAEKEAAELRTALKECAAYHHETEIRQVKELLDIRALLDELRVERLKMQVNLDKVKKALRDLAKQRQHGDCWCDTAAGTYCVGQPECLAAQAILSDSTVKGFVEAAKMVVDSGVMDKVMGETRQT